MTVRRIPLIAAIVTFIVHAAGNPHYGFFRDELYFIICGFHPDWGYVDQPPVVPLLAAVSQLFGHSLFLLRLIPSAFAAAGIYVTCLLAVELGGGAFAETVAAIAYFFAGVLMSFGMKVGPDMVGLWTWPLVALLVLRIVKGGDPRLWLWTGAALGLSIESKYTVLFFIAAMFAGLMLTPQRRAIATPWFAAGVAVAAAIALPNFIWQAAHGFPMWELLRNGVDDKNVNVGPGMYLFQQLLLANIVLAPVWIAGLFWLLRDGTTRFLGYTYVVLILLMIVFHGKHYYPGDVYPIVMAAGGVAAEAWTQRARFVRGALVLLALPSSLFLPFSLPILPEQQMVAYTQWVKDMMHVRSTVLATKRNEYSTLPPDWADMHGWPELTATIAKIYDELPPDQRAQAAIVASNYGEASAVDFFGPAYGLPPAISGHNNFWLWGTHGYSGNVVIDVNGDCGASTHLFGSARLAARFDDPWVMSYEHDIPIMVCVGIRQPIATVWPKMRNYI